MKQQNIIIAALIMMAVIAGTLKAQEVKAPEVTHTAIFTTTMGEFHIELYGKDAPKTVKNFVGLIDRGFYDGILFHRVVPGFVIQAGDPQTRDTSLREYWGMGGSSIYDGKEFEDELNGATPSYRRGYVEGTLAMANRGPNTNTSQFFIMLLDNDKRENPLPKLYTIFGRVVRGMDVVHQIELAPLTPQTGLPITPVIILKAKVVEASPAGR
jgi:cyclophilin family peptidyl-prolyl cis-trans isomerase